MISQLAESSLAAKAGLKSGDLIVACHGKEIKNSRDLRQIISMQNPGSRVEIMATRKGEKFTTMVEVGEAPVHQSLRRCTSRSI
jgi:serine protease Do